MENKEIAVIPANEIRIFSASEIDLIKNTIFPGANDYELKLFLEQCNRTKLDPFSNQITVFKQSKYDKASGGYIDSMVTIVRIDGFRIIAERSGKYLGQMPTLWCGPDGKWVDVWLNPKSPPSAAKVGVIKEGYAEPLWAVATLNSYGKRDKQGNLSGNWRSMPDVMLAKCAEALALRKAFPNDLSGLYTDDEMDRVSAKARDVGPEAQETNRPQKPVEPKPKPSENKSPKPSPSGEANDVAPHGFTEKPHLVDSHEPYHSMPDGDSLLLNDPGTYEIEVGQNAQRKRICDIPLDALEAWVHYWDDALTKTGGKAHVEKRLGKGFKVNAVAYLEFAKEIQEFDKQLEMGE